ncbi:MerR family transcriptional regulator [Hoeflea poritis]|uniref:MerR family transcriptional regulator n=1 Tax=Hoeflea poritis TaxID=2993659 RepID=A0ABT4VHI1_9HYPH|nr:MerR family transcriptional regulator [Hoeflea poritis]MDA4844171.1 MerR family transcriptional regulator [Hoeflea poritis]
MHTIGQASKLSGIHVETIRYYEREGILPRAEREQNGRRVYTKDDIVRMRFVRQCRDLGFPIRDTQALLMLTVEQTPCDRAQSIARKNLEAVREKISELSALERELDVLVSSCRSNDPGCALLQGLLGNAPQSTG